MECKCEKVWQCCNMPQCVNGGLMCDIMRGRKDKGRNNYMMKGENNEECCLCMGLCGNRDCSYCYEYSWNCCGSVVCWNSTGYCTDYFRSFCDFMDEHSMTHNNESRRRSGFFTYVGPINNSAHPCPNIRKN